MMDDGFMGVRCLIFKFFELMLFVVFVLQFRIALIELGKPILPLPFEGIHFVLVVGEGGLVLIGLFV